jgi:hypothetical protein
MKWVFPYIALMVQQLAALKLIRAAIWQTMFACNFKRILENKLYEMA